MSANVSVEDLWVPEPELRDMPPRRVTASDNPDLNMPNVMLFTILGGVGLVAGIALFIVGLAGKGALFTLGGLLLVAGGLAALILIPAKGRAHLGKAERLVTVGIPVPARILSSDSLNGSPTARSVRFQVANTAGELVHAETVADDSVLPKRIPSTVTALFDPQTGDVELYCVLPFRAVAKVGAEAATATAATAPVAPQPTTMGQMDVSQIDPSETPAPVPRRNEPKEEPKKRESYE